ncbi:unnamed protein product [Rangifer tarandus platyrhynchus]|uniref:Uncharacterized protein n=2 Tax=Rangifer tarandus platyrhynchus TaxID=3082113 RepID=A0ABN8Y6D3_RANTA|nr:unnamed protein product [Rangifer tarandus platyrhynchus]CAI9693329.1 unnamed protein product [Rangifer tarandus platyrhynchus]
MGQLPARAPPSTLLLGRGPVSHAHLLNAPVSDARGEEAAGLVRSSNTGQAVAAATCPWLGPEATEPGTFGAGSRRVWDWSKPEARKLHCRRQLFLGLRSSEVLRLGLRVQTTKLSPNWFLSKLWCHTALGPRLRSRHSPVALETEGVLVA